MSIDVNEAIKAIREMLPIIDPEEDYLTIVAAEEKIIMSETKRKKELEEAHAKLKALTKTYESARISSTRPASVPSHQAHITLLNELENSKLSLAKAISDAESLASSKDAELSALRDEARGLEAYDPALEHATKELDGSVLKLQVIRGMGFEPVVDEKRGVRKMIVRAASGDIHTVDMAKGKGFENTQTIWRLSNS